MSYKIKIIDIITYFYISNKNKYDIKQILF